MGTVVFGLAYWGYYGVLGGPTQMEELTADLHHVEHLRAESAKNKKYDVNQVDYVALMADPLAASRAKKHFVEKCAACHLASGAGSVGPNLTDKYWIHDRGTYPTIVKLINEGITAKGMPPWKNLIPDQEILELAAYVKSLEGTNVQGKEPQGELVD